MFTPTDKPAQDSRAEARRGRLIGLTGGIASGKSTVGRLLRDLGATVIDADVIARLVVEPGRPAYHKLVATFGDEILDSTRGDGLPAIDRAKLAARVFSDPTARAQLNAITHPEIGGESARQMQEALSAGAELVVYEATLLVENQSYLGFDGLLVVDIPEELQIARAVARGLTREQAEARLRSQTSRQARRGAANWIIDNSGDGAALRERVTALYPDLVAGEIPPRGR